MWLQALIRKATVTYVFVEHFDFQIHYLQSSEQLIRMAQQFLSNTVGRE